MPFHWDETTWSYWSSGKLQDDLNPGLSICKWYEMLVKSAGVLQKPKKSDWWIIWNLNHKQIPLYNDKEQRADSLWLNKKHIFLGCCGCCLPFTPVDFDGWGIIWPNGRWKAMSPYVFAWSRAMTRRENPRPKVLWAAFTPSNFYLRDLSKVDTSKMTEVYSSRWTRFPQNLRLSSQKLQTGCSEIQVLLSTYDLDKDDKAFIFARVWYNVCIIVMYLFIHIHLTIYIIYYICFYLNWWHLADFPPKTRTGNRLRRGWDRAIETIGLGVWVSLDFPFSGQPFFLLNYFAYRVIATVSTWNA